MNALLLAAALCVNPASFKLNSDGMTAYRAGKLEDALEKFRAAIAADDKNALAHYNFAATLGVFRKKKEICQHDAYKGAILEHLLKAIALDKGRKKRALEDKDFDDVKDTLTWQTKIAGLSWPKDAEKILTALTWYGPSPGAYGSTAIVAFAKGGAATAAVLELDSEGNPKRNPHAGTWKLSGDTLTVDFKEPIEGTTHFEGKLTPAGKITFPPRLGELTDEPSECEA